MTGAEAKGELARHNFEDGCNCCQAVLQIGRAHV